MRNLILALALLVPLSVHAAPEPHKTFPLGTRLTAVAINTTQSFTVQKSAVGTDATGFGILAVEVDYTFSAASAVVMTCFASFDGGSTFGQIQDVQVAAGVGTSSDASWTKSVAGNAVWPWRVNIAGFPIVRCDFDGTGADGSDVITVRAYLVAP